MYYYHADRLGSIIGISDAPAEPTTPVSQSYEYDSFGNLKDQKNRIKQPYAYTGREWDRETGGTMCPTYSGPGAEMRHAPLARYKGGHAPRARYYMPEIGRFIQEAPIKFRSGDANFYAYTSSSPIQNIDPMGLYGEWYNPICHKFTKGTSYDGLTHAYGEMYKATTNSKNCSIQYTNWYQNGSCKDGTLESATHASCSCVATCTGEFIASTAESEAATKTLKKIAKKYAEAISVVGAVFIAYDGFKWIECSIECSK